MSISVISTRASICSSFLRHLRRYGRYTYKCSATSFTVSRALPEIYPAVAEPRRLVDLIQTQLGYAPLHPRRRFRETARCYFTRSFPSTNIKALGLSRRAVARINQRSRISSREGGNSDGFMCAANARQPCNDPIIAYVTF